MIKLALIVSSLFVFSSLAMAHEGHQHPEPSQPITTPDEVCSDQTQNLCAHIHFYKTPNTTEESTFVFHVESDSDEELNQLTLDLWMDMGAGHGHGSAPLALERIGKNKYKVTNAWFVMMGAWQVRANFNLDHQNYSLIIPVNIYK